MNNDRSCSYKDKPVKQLVFIHCYQAWAYIIGGQIMLEGCHFAVYQDGTVKLQERAPLLFQIPRCLSRQTLPLI